MIVRDIIHILWRQRLYLRQGGEATLKPSYRVDTMRVFYTQGEL